MRMPRKTSPVEIIIIIPVSLRLNACFGLLILEVSKSHTTAHHSRQHTSGRVISSSQRPAPENTQQSQEIDFHAPVGIRTHNLGRRAPADLYSRQRSNWDRQYRLSQTRKQLHNLEYLNYWRSTITSDVGCTRQIKSRFAIAKAAFNRKKTFFTSKLELNLKMNPVKCNSRIIALYGTET